MPQSVIGEKVTIVLCVVALAAACATTTVAPHHAPGPGGSVGDGRTASAAADDPALSPRPSPAHGGQTKAEPQPDAQPAQPPSKAPTPITPTRASLPADRAPSLAEVTAALPLQVHPSQHRINGPSFFVEISGIRYVNANNPRGWAPPYTTDLPNRGWSVVLGHIMQAKQAGFTSVWLWEPTGQYEGIGGCMAWFSRKTVEDSWTPRMKETFPAFVRAVRDRLDMELIIYSGCAQRINIGSTLRPEQRDVTEAEIPVYVDALAFAAEMGATGVGLDGFAILQENHPDVAVKVAWAIRNDPRTKDLILACEGWPVVNPSLPYIQQQMISLDMLRDGNSVNEAQFAKFFRRVNNQRERQDVPGRVGVWLLHGSNWSDPQISKAYSLIRQHGMLPMDWRVDAPRRHWVGR